MRWIQYPNERARKSRRNGIPREGQIWADAPGVRRKWVAPSDGRSAGFAEVAVYEDAPEQNYALADWQGAAL